MISNSAKFTLRPELLSSLTELVTFGTETVQQNMTQVHKATALSQTLIPKAARLRTLDGAKDLTRSHLEAMTALSTEQIHANVGAFFDIFRHAYASLVGLRIVPNSIIASARFERALSACQDRTLEMTGQVNAALVQGRANRVAKRRAIRKVQAA